MCKKSPSIIYVYKKINTTKRSVLYQQLKEIPLNDIEYSFICDVIKGFSITELADKFHKTPSRISQWKREVCGKIHAFDIANFMH